MPSVLVVLLVKLPDPALISFKKVSFPDAPLTYVNEDLVGTLPASQSLITDPVVSSYDNDGNVPTPVILFTVVVLGVTVTLPAGVKLPEYVPLCVCDDEA